ncbi:glutamate decarboxylase, partial [Candidatus Methylacidithermus pantelleriae]
LAFEILMPLHPGSGEKEARRRLPVPGEPSLWVPRDSFPSTGQSPRHALSLVEDELLLDGNARQNLATFCTTWFEPETRYLMGLGLDRNLVDRDEYPQTSEIERRCVAMLAELWNAPSREEAVGCSTTGSSEACLLAGLALLWRWKSRAGSLQGPPNLVTGPVQVCWEKFCRYWEVELREIAMEPGKWVARPEEVLKRCDKNTIGVVCTLGLTFTGHYEPVEEVSAALARWEKEQGIEIPIHVDAASGGFVAPFIHPQLRWDFRNPKVVSINASGHKFGLAPLGLGWVLWREKSFLPRELTFSVRYLGGEVPTYGLTFSRPGSQVICQYYQFLRLGREGYRKILSECFAIAQFLASQLDGFECFQLVHQGDQGIPVVCWTLDPCCRLPFSLYDVADRLRTRGWLVPTYPLVPNCQQMIVQRAVIRPGFTMELAYLFVDDLKKTLSYLESHPPAAPLTQEELGMFTHGGR